jgi:hypothetical protein
MIAYERQDAITHGDGVELRVYFSGVHDVENGGFVVSDSHGNQFGARCFWFTFCGHRYQAFSHVFARLRRDSGTAQT